MAQSIGLARAIAEGAQAMPSRDQATFNDQGIDNQAYKVPTSTCGRCNYNVDRLAASNPTATAGKCKPIHPEKAGRKAKAGHLKRFPRAVDAPSILPSSARPKLLAFKKNRHL
jgi:hypothetical protein